MKVIINKIIEYILLVPLLLSIATALVIDNSLAHPVVSAKYSWFAVTLLLSIISALLLLCKNRKAIKLTIVDLLVSLFCLWGIIYSYWLFDEFTLKLCILTLLWIFYLVCRIIFSQTRIIYIVPLFIVLIGFIEAIWGLKQLYGYCPSQHSLFKTTGSFYNPGPYAGFLASVLPIAFYYLLFDYKSVCSNFKKENARIYIRWGISLLSFFTIITVIPATMSRASWFGAISGCLLIFPFYLLKGRSINVKEYFAKNRIRVCFLSVIMFILSLFFIFMVYHIKKDSADGRSFIWKNTIEAIQHNPQGAGVGRFAKYYGIQQISHFESNFYDERSELISGNPEYAFNEYLQIALEFGVLPFILFMVIIGYSLSRGIYNKQYGAVGGLASLLVFAFFSYPFNLLPFLIILVVFICLCVNTKNPEPQFSKKHFILSIGFIIALFSTSLAIIQKRKPMHEAYQKWRTLAMLNNKGIDEKQAVGYQLIYKYLNHESQFLFEYARCLNRLERYDESNKVLEKMQNISCDPMIYNVMGRNYQALKDYESAEYSFRKSSLMIPSRIYPYYLLMKLYDEQNDKDKTLNMINIILSKEVKIDSPAVTEIKEEANKLYIKYNPENL